MKTGNKKQAIINYKKTLKLNPRKTNEEKRVYELGEKNLKKLKNNKLGPGEAKLS